MKMKNLLLVLPAIVLERSDIYFKNSINLSKIPCKSA
jgi:hypothetical protein